jgi:hypothetical protein
MFTVHGDAVTRAAWPEPRAVETHRAGAGALRRQVAMASSVSTTMSAGMARASTVTDTMKPGTSTVYMGLSLSEVPMNAAGTHRIRLFDRRGVDDGVQRRVLLGGSVCAVRRSPAGDHPQQVLILSGVGEVEGDLTVSGGGFVEELISGDRCPSAGVPDRIVGEGDRPGIAEREVDQHTGIGLGGESGFGAVEHDSCKTRVGVDDRCRRPGGAGRKRRKATELAVTRWVSVMGFS